MKQPMAKRALAMLALMFAALSLALAPAPARADESDVTEGAAVPLVGTGEIPDTAGSYRVTFDYGDAYYESDGEKVSGFWIMYTDEADLTSKAVTLNDIIEETAAGTFYPGYTARMLSGGMGTFLGWTVTPNIAFDKVLEPGDFTYLEPEGYYNLTVTARWGVDSSHGTGALTSFEIANGDISLDGVDAYQIRVPSTSLIWETNPGASFDVVSVAVDNPEVASVHSSTDEATGKTTWSIGPGIVGGTTTLAAVAVDSNNPANKLEDKVTVTCTPGEGWTRVPDLTLGENGVLTVPMGWAEHGGFGLFDWDFWSTIYCDSTITVADESIAEGDSLGRSIIPKKPGATKVTLTIDDLYYGGTKTVTVQLVVTEGDAVTTLTNEQGASLSHVAQMVSNGFGGFYSDDNTWRNLDLVTEWLGGDAAATAGDAVNAAISDVNSMYVYDIHLEEYGQVFEIPEGDSVTVTLPLPDGMGTDGVHVYHVADDGTVTDMGATVDAETRTVTFTTAHFSTFVIAQVGSTTTTTQTAGQKAEPAGEKSDGSQAAVNGIPATGDPGCVIAALAAGSGAVVLLGSRMLRRRR